MIRTPPRLLERLRDLSLVELDALLSGCEHEDRERVLASHVADLEDALGQARREMQAAEASLARAGEPLDWVEWPADKRAGADGAEHAQRAAERLSARARQYRELAVLAEATALVVPRLAAAGRK